MIFLPIVDRELRVAMRMKWTYWSRVGLACLAFLFSLWSVQAEYQFRDPASVGRSIFNTITGLAFAFCLSCGAWITADALSRERREGTLGLLFLTDLKGYDIVLGKMAATSVNAIYGLLAVFPILALSLLFGGITGAEFWRMTATLLLTLLFSLSAGLFISALIHEHSKTIGWTLLFLAGTTFGPAALQLIVVGKLTNKLEWFSPAFLFGTAFEKGYGRAPLAYWGSFCVLALLSLSLLALAAWITPRSWQEQSPTAKALPFAQHWSQWALGSGPERKRFRSSLLEVNPVFWLAARHRIKARLVWIFFVAIALGWIFSLLKWRSLSLDMATGAFVSGALHFVLKIWAASEAGHLLAASRQNGSLELLLTTPLKIREILHGQILALRWQFMKPALAILGVDVALIVVAGPHQEGWFVLAAVAGMVFFVLDLYTLAYVAMWIGLKTRHASRASAGAIVRVLALPWAGVIFLTVFAGGFPRFEGMVVAAIITRGFVDYVMFFNYYSKLQQEFRKLAADETRSAADYNDDFGLLSDPLVEESNYLSPTTNPATSGR